MRKISHPKLFVFAVLLFGSVAIVHAQDPRPAGPPPEGRPAGPPETRFAGQGEPRPNLLRELGLTQDQMQALRRLNAELKPTEMSARRRFQEANRALNMAIYADNVEEADFQARLSEFQAAQAELAKIKFTNELAVRRLLTPAQLIKFRELRRRFAEERGNRPNDRVDQGRRPAMRRDLPMRPPGN